MGSIMAGGEVGRATCGGSREALEDFPEAKYRMGGHSRIKESGNRRGALKFRTRARKRLAKPRPQSSERRVFG